ncbi:MAG: 2-dehydropantoate 2-reductase, partial [Alphaproteobacteria bacterium]|nr:2-dehydropantoate 2-reductase [Alphaproteobacteria bacterium]
MKIVVFGAGGIGGYFGGRLAASGADVTFIARGAHLAAMRANGLKVESALGNIDINVNATDDPASVGPADYVLYCVKMYDIESSAVLAKPLVGPGTAVVTTQNGVDARERLAPILGASHVMGGVAQISATIAAPGVIRHVGQLARLVFGDVGGVSPRAKALEEACKKAGIDALATDKIDVEIWRKFVFLASVAGLSSMTRQPMGVVNADPDLSALLADAVAEIVAVARAKGIDLPIDATELVTKMIGAMPPQAKPSMLQDLERGNRIEVAGLSGKVAVLGRELGVPTPVHRTIYACLKPYV